MDQLDGLRAVAILLVIGFHAWFFLQFAMPSKTAFQSFSDAMPWAAGLVRRGDIGVDVFFVLSGYLLSWQLFRERQNRGGLQLKQFYVRRLFRIYPLYIVALAIVSIGPGPSFALLGNILAYNIWFDPLNIIIPWSWSLSVELEFYAIVPLLILFARPGRRTLLMVAGFSALAVGWSLWTLTTYPQLVENTLFDLEIDERRSDLVLYYRHLYASMPVRLSQFTLGLGAAWLVVHRPDAIRLGGAVLPVVIGLILVGLALPLLNNPYTHMTVAAQVWVFIELTFGRVGFALAIATIIALMQLGQLPRLKSALSFKPLEPIARFSFSMYLFHPVFVYLGIVTFVGKTPVTTVSGLQYLGVFAIALAGSMTLGAVTWYLIERPAIRFGHKKLFAAKPHPPVTST